MLGPCLPAAPAPFLSHGSGGTLWGYNKYWDMPFEVTVAASHRRRPGITVHRSRTLTEADIDCQLDVPVTSPARTLLDITPRLTDKRLRRAINDSRHARYLSTWTTWPMWCGATRRATAPSGYCRSCSSPAG